MEAVVHGAQMFQAWRIAQKFEIVHIRPGKPVENACCGSFNGMPREGLLNTTQF